MAAAGLDSIGAIVGYAVCSGISITSGSLVYSILSGPLQVSLLAIFIFLSFVLKTILHCIQQKHTMHPWVSLWATVTATIVVERLAALFQ